MHINISEISCDTVKELSNCKNTLYYYSNFNICIYKMYEFITTEDKLNLRRKKIYYIDVSKLLTRKRLQLRDSTLITNIAKNHLFIILIKNVENLQ